MLGDSKSWNAPLINGLFSPYVALEILKINIPPELEQDLIVWAPSMSGAFSVKSSYRVNQTMSQSTFPDFPQVLWKGIWKATLHPRQKHLLWWILANIMPTNHRISRFISLDSENCFLCGAESEDIDHLLLECPLITAVWFNSPWQIRLDVFAGWSTHRWIEELLTPRNAFPLEDDEKRKMIVFLAVSFEHIWMARNRWRLEGTCEDWFTISKRINSQIFRYWNGISKGRGGQVLQDHSWKWVPPPTGGMKMNFDVAFSVD